MGNLISALLRVWGVPDGLFVQTISLLRTVAHVLDPRDGTEVFVNDGCRPKERSSCGDDGFHWHPGVGKDDAWELEDPALLITPKSLMIA